MITMCRVMTGKDKVDSNLWLMGRGLPRGQELPQQDRSGDILIWKYLSMEDSR